MNTPNTHRNKRPNTRKIKIQLGDEIIGEGDNKKSLRELTQDSLKIILQNIVHQKYNKWRLEIQQKI